MKMRYGLLLCCLAWIPGATVAATAPDRIYVNAKIWTGDAARPSAEAFAVQGDRLVAVGTTAEVRALAGPSTQVHDLGGRRVVPGFNDAHWHLPARKNARLDEAGSVEVIQKRLVEYAAKLPAGNWVMGRGWVPGDFPGNIADKRYLDTIFPDRPVFIRDRDGHQSPHERAPRRPVILVIPRTPMASQWSRKVS